MISNIISIYTIAHTVIALNVLNYMHVLCCNVYRYKMGATGVLTFLAVSCVLAAYLFYVLVPMPSDIDQGDGVFWIFVQRKFCRAIVSLY